MRVVIHRGYPGCGNNEQDILKIHKSLEQGYDAEVDIWKVNNKLYLGHDRPCTPFDLDSLPIDRTWYHCKNGSAYEFFLNERKDCNAFVQDKDPYSVTTLGYIWCNVGVPILPGLKCVVVLPERCTWDVDNKAFAVCTDSPILFS
jgi:hypothetical protein